MVECLRCARLESAAHPTASRVAPAEAAAVSDRVSGGYKFLTY